MIYSPDRPAPDLLRLLTFTPSRDKFVRSKALQEAGPAGAVVENDYVYTTRRSVCEIRKQFRRHMGDPQCPHGAPFGSLRQGRASRRPHALACLLLQGDLP